MKRALVILVVLLAAGNLALLARSWWMNKRWEVEMVGMADYAGAIQAEADFRHGKLRVYQLLPDTKLEDAHRRDGPFEVWTWPYYPILGHAHEFAQGRFVGMYDEKMRFMYAHPDQFGPSAGGNFAETTQPSNPSVISRP